MASSLKSMEPIAQKIARLRHEYEALPLDEASVSPDPVAQFQSWFDDAVKAEQPDPEAMTLATATPDAQLSARVVLLKGCDARGFVFFTNYESHKGRELAANASAALTFFWSLLHRQIRIEGTVEKTSRQESEDYFQTRPRGSQLGAWASPQSDQIVSRAELEQRLAEVEARFASEPIYCPPFWGGFRLRPARIEFWQGRISRLHDRIVYVREREGWRIVRLAP